MPDGVTNLGKVTLDLEANLAQFKAAVREGEQSTQGFRSSLDALAAVANIAERELNKVKMGAAQGAESQASAKTILEGVRGVSDEARAAAEHLDNVKLTAAQAAETRAAADVQAESLKKVGRQAEETTAKVEVMNRAVRTTGVGVGPFGSGFGRIGLFGTAVGAGTLLGPAAVQALGALASLPTMLAGAAGGLGTLALAFQGVGKAIGGDYKAFQELTPAQQQFTLTVRSLDGALDKLKQTAAQNLFPGLTEGLKSALSPGTLGAVTQAVGEFGRAIGQAGAQWGKYFGSTQFQQIFGPLMASGAHNLTVLSDAALHLFDALGVLGRAAIPLTSWMTQAVDKGSQLADTWLRGKDASGALAGAMTEIQSSIRLVGGLLESAGRAVVALGTALYPVSKVAVKDLTDGLNALAGIITRNQGAIREIVGGALNALVGAVKVASDGVKLLVGGLSRLVGERAPLIAMIGGVGAALTLAMGPQAAAVTGAILAVGLIERKWSEFKVFFAGLWDGLKGILELGVYGQLAIFSKLFEGLAKGVGWIPKIGGAMKKGLDEAAHWIDQFRINGIQNMSRAGDLMGSAWASAFSPQVKGALTNVFSGSNLSGAVDANVAATESSSGGKALSYAALEALWVQAGGSKQLAPTMAAIAMAESSGRTNALNNNPSTGDYSVGPWQINFFGNMLQSRTAQFGSPAQLLANPLLDAKAAVALAGGGTGLGNWSTYKSGAYRAYLSSAPPPAMTSPFGAEPAFTTNVPTPKAAPVIPDMPGYTTLLNNLGKFQLSIPSIVMQNINSMVVTGAKLIPEQLRSQLTRVTASFTAQSAVAAALTGQAASDAADALRGNLLDQASILGREVASLKGKMKGAIPAQQAAIVKELGSVQTELKSVQQQIVQSLQQNVQTLQQKVGTLFTSVTGSLTSQFDAQTQAKLGALGQQYYQNGAQTPLEAQLAAMQQQDQLQSLQDAVSNATDDATRAQAQRALDEFNLSIAAQKERTQADQDYATQAKQIQEERAKQEQKLTVALGQLGDRFQNGTGTMDALNKIAKAFGLQVATGTVPDLDSLSKASSRLQNAFGALADYVDHVTGTTSTASPGSSSGGGGSASAAVAAATAAATYFTSGGNTYFQSNQGKYGKKPLLAEGGIVMPRLGGVDVTVAERGHPEAVIPLPDGLRSVEGGTQMTVAAVGNEVELGLEIGKLMQRANKRGIRFQLV